MNSDPIKNLYASQASDVDSAQMIDVFLGQGNEHLLIFSGIAKPGAAVDDGNTSAQNVVVHFDQTVSAMVQATATVGLARIENNDSDFTFSTNSVEVVRDSATGRLALVCNIYVHGDNWTDLTEFSYSASVVASVDEPYVAGLIQWNPSATGRLGAPLSAPLHGTAPRVPPRFQITALRDLPGPSPLLVPTPFAVTHETAAFSTSGDLAQVPYTMRLGNIPGAVDDPFELLPEILPGAFPHAHKQLRIVQTSGPSRITLSGVHLHEDGVDFFVEPFDAPT